MLWLYDCICMILKATSESEVVENNNHVPEKFTEFDNQRKMEAFFLILIDWTTCWLPTVFFIYNAGHYFRCSLTLLVNTCLLFIGKIKKVAKVICSWETRDLYVYMRLSWSGLAPATGNVSYKCTLFDRH